MSTQQRDKVMDLLYKTGFFLLLAVCTYFIKDIHGDFKEAVHELKIDVGTMKVEVGIIKSEIQNLNKTKDAAR